MDENCAKSNGVDKINGEKCKTMCWNLLVEEEKMKESEK